MGLCYFLLSNFFFLFQRGANIQIMLFWELPVPISSAYANLRFSSQCSLSCPPTLLITNTLEIFCTWADFPAMQCCRQIPPSTCPNLRLSNSKWSQSLWEHAFSSFSNNYKT